MKLQFTSDGNFTLAGAFVETYLLEKSRLVYQVDGERNFHIFYQLLAGGSESQRRDLSLTRAQDYHYLKQSGCYVAEDTDDSKCFHAVMAGLKTIGLTSEEQDQLLSVVAGLLHMGNIEFEEEETPEGEAAIVSSKPEAGAALRLAASLLGVTEVYLLKVIAEREIVTRDETFTVRRNAQNSIYARDAIAKSIYGRLFDWIISRVNLSLGQDPAPLPYIGVLDIFGFESFQRNDFEQLLINYTNEVLQATFNNQVFIAEMELYKREGITVGKIEWPDNRECVELIASKPQGILQILDNEAMNPKPSDAKFLAMLHKTHAKNAHFPRPHPKDMQEMFIVRHFAGSVTYTVGAFMDKNNDTIPKDMADLFLSSTKSILPALFATEAKESLEVSSSKSSSSISRGRRPSKKLKSVAAKFSRQMNQLVETLDATRCNFIRCIKPNASMKLGLFDSRYVVGQLRCQGIMQTAQVLKVGLPTRVTYDELVLAYKKLMPPDAQRLFSAQSDATLISAILWAFQVPMDSYKLGITKLFFKAGKIAMLDSILRINWQLDGPRVVKRMKLWLARRRWRVALAKVQSVLELTKLLRRVRSRKDAVRQIHSWFRGTRVRVAFVKTRAQVIKLQAHVRGMQGRVRIRAMKLRLIAEAEARAEAAAAQAEVAKAREEEAREALARARREAEMREIAEDERRAMEAEADAFEAEARELAQLALEAVREAESAAAEAAEALENERQAEIRATKEALELESRLVAEREAAEKRKAESLERAAAFSSSIMGGLGSMTTQRGLGGDEVNLVDIPEDMSDGSKEQLAQLNSLLLSGQLSQSEYDELVPHLLHEEEELGVSASSSSSAGAVSLEEQEALDRLRYEAGSYGIQIRCPVCGISNNTANGSKCTECGAMLTGNDRASEYYAPRVSSMNSSRALSGRRTSSSSANSNFVMDGQRVKIHGGYFQCQIHGTQILSDENYAEYTTYVLRCSWQPEGDSGAPSHWLSPHRYSEYERLHKILKVKIPPQMATLPAFPKKHVWGGILGGRTGNSSDVVDERKRGLESYINQVIDLCARLPDTALMTELDRFLTITSEITRIKSQLMLSASFEHGQDSDAQYPGVRNHEVERLAAEERTREPNELPNPFDGEELMELEQTVATLNQVLRDSTGDLRRNTQVQHLLKICVQLQPRLQMSASLDNPFANSDLIPRAMQCQEDLETTIGLYNDSLLAVTESYDRPPAPFAPGASSGAATPFYQQHYTPVPDQ